MAIGKAHSWLVCASALALVQAPAAYAQAAGSGSDFELVYWKAIQEKLTPEKLEAYLRQFPNGVFAELARLELQEIRAKANASTSATLPPTPVQVPAPVVVAPPTAISPAAPILNLAPPPTLASASPPARPSSGNLLDDVMVASSRQPTAPVTALAAPVVTLPPRPTMAVVPVVSLPDNFCSALERNTFHDRTYRPARSVANTNNENAIAYLEELKRKYVEYEQAGDLDALKLIADTAKAYAPAAEQAYETSVQYDHLFGQLMAVPVVKCDTK